MQYLVSTRHLGIKYRKEGSTFTIQGYSDSNWAGCEVARKSISGYVIMASGGAISWKSKLQTIVAHSTIEAEYVGLSECAREIMWLRSLLFELGHGQEQATWLYGDNTASISVAEIPRTHARSKSIDIRHHSIRGFVEANHIKLKQINTQDMTADIFTKALGRRDFIRHRTALGMRTALTHIPGGVSESEC